MTEQTIGEYIIHDMVNRMIDSGEYTMRDTSKFKMALLSAMNTNPDLADGFKAVPSLKAHYATMGTNLFQRLIGGGSWDKEDFREATVELAPPSLTSAVEANEARLEQERAGEQQIKENQQNAIKLLSAFTKPFVDRLKGNVDPLKLSDIQLTETLKGSFHESGMDRSISPDQHAEFIGAAIRVIRSELIGESYSVKGSDDNVFDRASQELLKDLPVNETVQKYQADLDQQGNKVMSVIGGTGSQEEIDEANQQIAVDNQQTTE